MFKHFFKYNNIWNTFIFTYIVYMNIVNLLSTKKKKT